MLKAWLCLLVCLIAGMAWGQEWLGPYNHTGDTLIPGDRRIAIEDANDNLHLVFALGDSSIPTQVNLFHVKFSPQGEMLMAPHQVTFNGRGAEWTGIFNRDVPYIDVTFLQPTDMQGGWTLFVLRLDFDGNVVEALRPLLDLPQDIGPYESWSVSMDSQFRYHILYGTYSLLWPAVVYARVSREGELQVGPDTIAYEQPYYHMRFSSAVGPDDRLYGVYSNVDGFDQYLQAVVIDTDGTVIVPPFNPLPDTTHMPIAGQLSVGSEGQVVMFTPLNPPGPVGGRIDLYRFDASFSFVDCTNVEDTIVGYGAATGFIAFDGNGQDRMLSVWQTYEAEASHVYTLAHDYGLNVIGTRDSVTVAAFQSLGAITPVCASGFEMFWMDGSLLYGPPGSRLYSWFRIVNPDCLAVVGPRAGRTLVAPQVAVWPNPTNGNIWISGPWGDLTAITLYDILGRHVQTLEWQKGVEQESALVSMESLPSGSYYLHFATVKGTSIVPLRIAR